MGVQGNALNILLNDLGPVAAKAESELKPGASVDEIAAHAVKVNIFHTMEKLLSYSEIVRDKVQSGEVQLHGAIYDIVSGQVEFVGQSPRLPLLLGSHSALVPGAKFPTEGKTQEPQA